MNKRLLSILALLLTLTSYSQISFEKGYYITNTDEKIEGLIKNIDWMDNPTEIAYKANPDAETTYIGKNATKEFGVYGISKYVKARVNIERSSENFNYLGENKDPEFKEETLFLRTVVEGPATLYSYSDGAITKFFYQKDGSEIRQLIYKVYLAYNEKEKIHNIIAYNNSFRTQIWKELPLAEASIEDLRKITYSKNSLTKYFITYNKAQHSSFVDYTKGEKRNFLSLSIRPRIKNSSLKVGELGDSNVRMDYGNKLVGGLGLELEYFLHFNKNKWSVFTEPTYQRYRNRITKEGFHFIHGALEYIGEIEYNTFEIPFGARHYMYLNATSSIFINVALIVNKTLKSEYRVYDTESKTSFYSAPDGLAYNYSYGIGFKPNRSLSVEARIHTPLSLFTGTPSDYRTASFILGYTIFNTKTK